nr:hypothetical protein [uncultured Bacteroides sp.]
MDDIFIKKKWDEENIVFYIHFKNNVGVRQLEVYPNEKRYLSESNPFYKDSGLCDQSLETLDLEERDFIDEMEFDNVWNNRKEDDNIY